MSQAQRTCAPNNMTFEELKLAPAILEAVREQGYEHPTPIQAEAIPAVLAGHDLLAGAQTGTGKTAGFTLPLLQRLATKANASPSPARHPVRALVLAPTRELADQVAASIKGYAARTQLRSTVVFGGIDMKPQTLELKAGVEVLIATPGRLLDHIEAKNCVLNQVEYVVLDEADRMLDMGFIPDIQRILNLLPKTRQGLLFSATFSTEIQRLADTMLQNPEYIEVAKRNSVSDTITHQVHPVAESRKMALLVNLLRTGTMNQALVFVRTKQGCSRLARALQHAGIKTDAIHGDKSQSERMKALNAFKAGEMQALVATDVAARGIDIEELPYVVNYELPHTPEDYVHRIGRTGRAGNLGNALSLVSADETGYLADIEKLINKPITQIVMPGFEPEEDWCYPPSGKKRDRSALNSNRGAERNERSPRGERSDRNERSERRPERAERHTDRPQPDRSRSHYTPKPSTVAADGFDFNKPYESAASTPSNANDAKPAAPSRRPGRMVAALLGGIKKTQP